VTWADVVDRAIELPVATSYSRIGPAVRRRVDHWRPLHTYDLSGRFIAITGPTSGLGRVAAQELAAMGADLLLLARDREKAERVRKEIVVATGNDLVDVIPMDLADLASVRAGAEKILARGLRLDVLIHNAGALPREHALSADGIELTVATHVVAPFLLTHLLLDRLIQSTPSRVITMSSGGMYTQGLTVDHLELSEDEYKGPLAYARAKRAQVTLNQLWARRTREHGVRFHALHPGWADTPGLRESLPRFRRLLRPLLRTAEEGADTMAWLSADDGAPLASSGRFWLDRRPRPIHLLGRTRRTDTPARRARLWAWCEERAGLK
jgi:NAD(P)-dependent dehydrogenase (short-subunit alcohol dehydrogenase family)